MEESKATFVLFPVFLTALAAAAIAAFDLVALMALPERFRDLAFTSAR
jgi:hypothetical protein